MNERMVKTCRAGFLCPLAMEEAHEVMLALATAKMARCLATVDRNRGEVSTTDGTGQSTLLGANKPRLHMNTKNLRYSSQA